MRYLFVLIGVRTNKEISGAGLQPDTAHIDSLLYPLMDRSFDFLTTENILHIGYRWLKLRTIIVLRVNGEM